MSLPSAYQEVEYIQSSGTQYIDTGYIIKPSTKTQADFQYLVIAQSARIDGIGGDNATSSGCTWTWYLGDSAGNFKFGISNGGGQSTTWNNPMIASNTNRYVFIGENGKATINTIYGTQVISKTTAASITQNATHSSGIFAQWNMDSNSFAQMSSGKLYSYKIRESGTLVRDFVPCYRKSDNVIGLYDLVNDTFYTNSGTGTFTKGPNVEPPVPTYKLHGAIQTFHHILTLLSYSDLVAMATNEGNPRTDTLAELNSMKGGYHNSLSGHLTTRAALNSVQYDTIDGISYYQFGVGTWRIGYMGGYWYRSLFNN